MNTSIPAWTRRWPDPTTGQFVVEIQLGQVADELGTGWHLDAIGVSVRSETRAVTSTILRRVHVWTLTREAIRDQVAWQWELERNGPSLGTSSVHLHADGTTTETWTPDDLVAEARRATYDEAAKRLRLDEVAERTTGRPRTITNEFLADVAEVWLRAKAGGDPEPRRAVAAALGQVPPATAGRWITRARDAGLLPPSGRARKDKETGK